MWQMRRSKADKYQKRSVLLFGLFYILQGQLHGYIGTFSFQLDRLTVVTHPGIVFVKIGCSVPRIKSVCSRIGRLIGADGTQVPFSEKTGLIPVVFEDVCYGLFLWAKRVSPIKYAQSGGVSAGQNTRPGRGADRCGIISVQPEAGHGHLVEIGCNNVVVPCITHIAVTLVIGHYDYEIGTFFGNLGPGSGCPENKQEKYPNEGDRTWEIHILYILSYLILLGLEVRTKW